MIHGFGAAAIRAAERPLLDAGEPLMLRAAQALADRIRVHLTSNAQRPRPSSGSGPYADAVTGAPHADTAGTAAGSSDAPAPSAQRVLLLAGSGANGGDGLHAAATLRRDGVDIEAIAVSDTVHDGGATAFTEADGTIHQLNDLDQPRLSDLVRTADLVVDAILGIGGRPQIPAHLTELLRTVRDHGVPVIAVDLPSFLDATTGAAAEGALVAVETVTFGAVKAGLLLPAGTELAGTLHLADIGLEPSLTAQRPDVLRLTDADVQQLWPRPGRDATKYSRGVVTVAAGSSAFPGAAVLASAGAARTGAGMVRCVAPAPVLDLVLRTRPEIIGHRAPDADAPPGAADAGGHETAGRPAIDLEQIGRTHALVVGSGMPPQDPRARAGVELLLIGTGELERGVIDAGGLDTLTGDDRFGPHVILTPHGGEAARLARRLDIDPRRPVAELASALAARTGATVLHKGAVTVIAPGDGGPLRTQDDATSQLATAGTGDVLAGMLGALLAAGLPGPDAAALGALLHGRAGRCASRDGLMPLVALDVADHLPRTLAAILADATP